MEIYDAMCDPDRVVASVLARKLERERDEAREQRDKLVKVIKAASVLIAAKGRHNTMLAYNRLRDALQSLTPKP